MPIKPERMALYPGGSIRSPEWLAIRERILGRANHRCEQCNAPNLTVIYREPDVNAYVLKAGETYDACTGEFLGMTRGSELLRGRFVRVVLTIAHLDQNETNNADDNLKALCQLCHNALDAPHRRRNAADTRRARKAVGELFEAVAHD